MVCEDILLKCIKTLETSSKYKLKFECFFPSKKNKINLCHALPILVAGVFVRAETQQELLECGDLSTADGDAQCAPHVGHESGGVEDNAVGPGLAGDPLQTCHVLAHHLHVTE